MAPIDAAATAAALVAVVFHAFRFDGAHASRTICANRTAGKC